MTETEHLLCCLSEECAEVAQRASKAMRFGLDEVQPGQHLNNADRLTVEVHDLVAVLELLRERAGLKPPTREAGEAMVAAKKEKVLAYLDYSMGRAPHPQTVHPKSGHK